MYQGNGPNKFRKQDITISPKYPLTSPWCKHGDWQLNPFSNCFKVSEFDCQKWQAQKTRVPMPNFVVFNSLK